MNQKLRRRRVDEQKNTNFHYLICIAFFRCVKLFSNLHENSAFDQVGKE